MTTYEVTLKNGDKYRFEHPSENLTTQQAADLLSRHTSRPSSFFESTPARVGANVIGGVAGTLAFPEAPFASYAAGAKLGDFARAAMAGEPLIQELFQHPFKSPLSTAEDVGTNYLLGRFIGYPAAKGVLGGAAKVFPTAAKAAETPGLASVARGVLGGATAGGATGAVQGAAYAPPGLKNRFQGMVQGAKEGTELGALTGGAVQAGGDFLRLAKGNRAAIESLKSQQTAAEQEMAQKAHERVQTYRRTPEGLPSPLSQAIVERQNKIFEPINQMADSIPGRASPDAVSQKVDALYGNDPETSDAIKSTIDKVLRSRPETSPGDLTNRGLSMSPEEFKYVMSKVPGSYEGFSASDLVKAATDLSGKVSKGVKSGSQAASNDQRIIGKAKHVLYSVLEGMASPDQKGVIQNQLNEYSLHLTDRDLIYEYFAPGARHTFPTDPGDAFIQKAALGKLSPSEKEFLARFERDYGDNPARGFEELASQVKGFPPRIQKEQQKGQGARYLARTIARWTLLYPVLRAILRSGGK